MNIKVGDVCRIERRVWWARDDSKPEHVWTATVTKVTPKRAYFGNNRWVALDDPTREVKPRYLDYRSRVAEVSSSSDIVGE